MAVLMTEEYWMNSQLSIARIYGGIRIGGEEFKIVNKEGYTLEELSDVNGPHYVGDDAKAIEAGEPADLLNVKWIPAYKKLGRDRIIELLEQGKSLEEVERLIVEVSK